MPSKAMALKHVQLEDTSITLPETSDSKEGSITELTDQTRWMLAIRDKRDKQAFARLFDHYAPRLKAMVVRGGARPDLAEDIVQDVFVTVWRKSVQFDPHRAQVSAWIYQIARNRQIDIARRSNRPVPEELIPDETVPDDATQIMALEQEAGHLRKALGALPKAQRQMIEKAYLGELTHQEISEQTGLPLGTIKSRIRLGLNRLRHELKTLRHD